MKIVADENIPLVDYYFGAQGTLLLKPGRLIVRDDLLDADLLLVRSVTSVNAALLADTAVKFVASATTGADHLDTAWLDAAGIAWYVAEGCNRAAVVDYVIAVVASLQKTQHLPIKNPRVGIVGVGGIGAQVAEVLAALGFAVVLCDPYRAQNEADFPGVALADLADCDLITLHTPLSHDGAYPTYHMIDKTFLLQQKAGAVLLNTGRGAVINFADLKQFGTRLHWCLDVWEHEPTIDLAVLQQTVIATPHIAGYSVQAKYRGIAMLYQAALQRGLIRDTALAPVPFPRMTMATTAPEDWRDIVLAVYDPVQTTRLMQQVLQRDPQAFDALRKNFQQRHELDFVDWAAAPVAGGDNLRV